MPRNQQRQESALALTAAVLAVLCAPLGFLFSVVTLARLRPTEGPTFFLVLVGLVVGAVGTLVMLWWWLTQGQLVIAPPRYAHY
jgi:hypothetical protein